MKDICGRPMLWHVLQRVRAAKTIKLVVLAITTLPTDDVLVALAGEMCVPLYRGPDQDVLSRYYGAAMEYGAEIVVRITGDNPLVDPGLIDVIVQTHVSGDYDYTSNSLERTFPLGLDVEAVSMEALTRTHQEATRDYEREHVTPYIWQHPEMFRLQNVEASGRMRWPDLRLTVDTAEDLQLIREIYNGLCRNDGIFTALDVINFLKANPDLVGINAHVQQKGLGSE